MAKALHERSKIENFNLGAHRYRNSRLLFDKSALFEFVGSLVFKLSV